MHRLFCQSADGRSCCSRLPAKSLAIRRQQTGYASVLSDMGLSVRYTVNRFGRAWASRWQPEVKIHLALYPHVHLTCPSTGHEFSTVRHSPYAKIETHCVLRHLTMFLGGPVFLNLLYHSTTHLRETFVAARRHKTIHTCLLHHKICGHMMVFHVRRAVTSSFKLLCKITNYILGVDIWLRWITQKKCPYDFD